MAMGIVSCDHKVSYVLPTIKKVCSIEQTFFLLLIEQLFD